MPGPYRVTETMSGVIYRHELSLNDPPLMAINCTSNCFRKLVAPITFKVDVSMHVPYLFGVYIDMYHPKICFHPP